MLESDAFKNKKKLVQHNIKHLGFLLKMRRKIMKYMYLTYLHKYFHHCLNLKIRDKIKYVTVLNTNSIKALNNEKSLNVLIDLYLNVYL